MSSTSLGYSPSIPVRTLRAVWRVFEAANSFIDTFWMVFGVFLLLTMWGMLFFWTVAKWADAYSLGWVMEIVKYMMAWSIFVVAGPVTKSNDHIRVSFVPEKLLGQKRGAAFSYAAENLVGLGMCLYFTYHSYRFIIDSYNSGFKELSLTGDWTYPMWVIRIGILVGFLFADLFYFERTLRWIKNLITHTEVDTASKGFMGGPSSSTQEEKESQPETGAEAPAGFTPPADREETPFEEQA